MIELYGKLPYYWFEVWLWRVDMASLNARLEARLSHDVYALIKRAAELEGRSVSDFVVSAAASAAPAI